MLDNERLRDPDDGVQYFLRTIRPFFVKGTNHVFLWRFLQFFKTYRGSMEIVHWIGRFEITLRRLRLAWMDLLDLTIVPPLDDQNFPQVLNNEQRAELEGIEDVNARVARAGEMREGILQNMRTEHDAAFPFSDNMIALLFLTFAELNEGQRERFVSSMSLRQINMQAYTYLGVKQLFMELFTSLRLAPVSLTPCFVTIVDRLSLF